MKEIEEIEETLLHLLKGSERIEVQTNNFNFIVQKKSKSNQLSLQEESDDIEVFQTKTKQDEVLSTLMLIEPLNKAQQTLLYKRLVEAKTIATIATELKSTPARIRQLEQKAKRNLIKIITTNTPTIIESIEAFEKDSPFTQLMCAVWGGTTSTINELLSAKKKEQEIRKQAEHIMQEAEARIRALNSQPTSTPLSELELSVRSYSSLMRAGVTTVEKLMQLSNKELLKIKNLGTTCLKEIEEAKLSLIKSKG